jgi:hypothetical protein
LELIADQVDKILKSGEQYLMEKPIFMCGGNINSIGGARDLFSKSIGAYIAHCTCPYTKQDRTTDLAISSLLALALRQ